MFTLLSSVYRKRILGKQARVVWSIGVIGAVVLLATVGPSESDAAGLGDRWGVWDFIDGGLADPTAYGDVINNGTALTAKGELHRARATGQQVRRDGRVTAWR